MQSDDLYRALGKSLIDENEDELALFIGRAANDWLANQNETEIDIIKVITKYINKNSISPPNNIPTEVIEDSIKEAVKNYKESTNFKEKLKSAVDKALKVEARNNIFGPIGQSYNTTTPLAGVLPVYSGFDIHQALNSYKQEHGLNQTEEVKKFVDTRWTDPTNIPLDKSFFELPTIGETDFIVTEDEAKQSGEVITVNGQTQTNVDL